MSQFGRLSTQNSAFPVRLGQFAIGLNNAGKFPIQPCPRISCSPFSWWKNFHLVHPVSNIGYR
jgi:hypothetical protein